MTRDVEALEFESGGLGLGAGPLASAGNRVELLRNGEAYFPALLAAIDAAQRWVQLETYIFAEDNMGARVAGALADAASRGVEVRLVLDGFGCANTADALRAMLTPTGVQVRVFRPARWWRLGRRHWRRLHRKIAVVDDAVAFVGGINVIDDHHHRPGERGVLGPRYDYAVRVQGPLVADVALTARRLWWRLGLTGAEVGAASLPPGPRQAGAPLPGGVAAALLLRDNLRNRRTIERAYLRALAPARKEVLIVSAYFVPGRRFLTALMRCAQRGVRVRLLLQGRVDHRLYTYAEQALWDRLLAAGIEVHRYLPSYLHAKAAVVDGAWATVGSSNIDPYSLWLALEANVAVQDQGFAQALAQDIAAVIENEAAPVLREEHERRPWWSRLAQRAAYGVVRFVTWIVARRRDL
ncbi:MAG TPA: cardiolipin synthase ClsB [Burkholderiaceae bacterium]|nr:cardiolipin synthase ClsB [Burkholderiaceae bacterium]